LSQTQVSAAPAPPRVLFVRNARGHTEISGPETYMLAVMPTFQAQGIDVALHCTINPSLGAPKWLADFEAAGIPTQVHSVGSAAGFSDVADVIRTVRKRQATVLHSFDHRSDLVALLAARRTGAAAVASFAGWTNWTGKALKERVYMSVDRWALNRADAVLIDSAFVGRAAGIKTGPRPVVVLPNGVDLARFSQSDETDLKQRHFGDPSVLLLGIVGRIHPNKGQLDFVRAAADLSARHPEARFLIVGATPEGHEDYGRAVTDLIKQAGLSDKVHQIVARPVEIPGIMAAMDILLAPCHTESCSFAILEAMASAKPVVAARAGGNPELVAEEITGLFVPPNSWESLRDAAERLIADPEMRASLGQAGYQKIRNGYSVARMVEHTRSIYQSVLAMPRQPARLRTCLETGGFTLLVS